MDIGDIKGVHGVKRPGETTPWLGCVLALNLPSICHRTYFHTSKGHVTCIIKKVNKITPHCGVAYESVCSLARGHVIRV